MGLGGDWGGGDSGRAGGLLQASLGGFESGASWGDVNGLSRGVVG